MARPYSPKFVAEISARKQEEDSPGEALGRVCVEANIPAAYVADILNVSRMTLYSWFRGKKSKARTKEHEVLSLISIIRKDMQEGILPCRKITDAKAYVYGIVGRPVDSPSIPKQAVPQEVNTALEV